MATFFARFKYHAVKINPKTAITVAIFNASEYDDVIILTACRDSRLLEFIDEVGYDCNKIYLISNNKRKIVQEQFCLNEDYSLERI